MTVFWGAITRVYDSLFWEIKILGDVIYVEAYMFKVVNCILLILTTLSILSFLIDERVVDGKDARKMYYIALLNPATFYIAFIFIQTDTLPLYLLVLGMLLLRKRKEDILLPAILMALGVSCKPQLDIFIPNILIVAAYVCLIGNDDSCKRIGERIKLFLKFLLCYIGTLGVVYIIPLLGPTAFRDALGYAPQAGRIWFTTLQYAPTLYLYISLFTLIIFTMMNLFNFSAKCSETNVILNGLIFYGVDILVLSFAIMSTPSTLIHIYAELVIVFCLNKDWVRNSVVWIFSVLIIFGDAFAVHGDIFNIFRSVGISNVMQDIYNILNGEQQIKLSSIIFTISKAGMRVYAIYLYKYSKRVLEGEYVAERCNEKYN